MIFLISLLLAILLSWFGSKAIKKHANVCYILSALLSAAVIGVQYTGAFLSFPAWVTEYIWPVFANCSLATAIFVVVMFMGALPNGSSAIKRLMPVRAELSIIACILTLGHNIGYGRTYFVKLFTDPAGLKGAYLWAAVVSVVLILLMLPLMVTSFPAVRKKMKPKRWKQLQRTAYLFYALIYVHVLILNGSFLAAGRMKYLFNLILYTVVFAVYAIMRTRKALVKKKSPAAVLVPAGIGIGAAVLLLAVCVPALIPSADVQEFPETGEPAVSTPVGTEEETAEQVEEITGDGVYTGKGSGYTGEITMSVTIADGAITAIDVVEAHEDEPFWSKALRLTDEILRTQSTDVDTVTAATISSEAILEAVNNALALAGWTDISTGTTVSETEAPETQAPETKAPETEAPETQAPETQAPETQAPETTAPETSAPETSAPAAVSYADGAYFGTGEGFNGEIQVAVMISGGKITSVVVVTSAEDASYLKDAQSMIDDIVSTQSTEVDTVTGATFTSKGIIAAVSDALSQAKN